MEISSISPSPSSTQNARKEIKKASEKYVENKIAEEKADEKYLDRKREEQRKVDVLA